MLSIFRGYAPNWLYQLPPYLYILAGILTILVLRNAMAVFSGGMLITAGLMVWSLHKKNREALLPSANIASKDKNDSGLIHIVWRPSFASGHKIIDDQHRSLFTDANELIEVITNHQPSLVINAAMRELIKDIQTHFRTEEEILEKLAPGIVASHKAIHAQLLEETRALADRVLQKQASPRDLIGFLVFDVISSHLVREDSGFFQAINMSR